MGNIYNPLLKGFYPDPSICRVGNDYYIVNSTFSYAPGVPVFHSRDLIHWKQIGHVLEREEQLRLKGVKMSHGIYAPCIRYYKETYYMITTNVSGGGNFYVTAEKPEGPWSDPIYLKDAEGIDPSLFFEGNDCYYIGQRGKKDAKYYGDCEIWIQKLDLNKGELTGEVHVVWDGAFKNAVWAEGPHLYKRGDYYYVLIAEGGTAYEHSICIARSRRLFGPYEPCPYNPILTHRHLGHNAKVQNVGHGDIVETPNGQWYIVMLGTRPKEGYAPLGRETFFAELVWENNWPIVNPGEGKLRDIQEVSGDQIDSEQNLCEDEKNIKWKNPLDKRCIFFRFPEKGMYEVEENGKIALKTLPQCMSDDLSPAYIGTRVTSMDFHMETMIEFTPCNNQEAGLIYLHDENNYVRFVITVSSGNEEGQSIKIVKVEEGKEIVLFQDEINRNAHRLKMHLKGLELICMAEGNKLMNIDIRRLTSEAAGGFVGCTMGIYATSNHDTHSSNYARFSELIL
ncbi:MAG: glycoside hydrolase family 43 protein [Clostridiales bacterium]|nr:glycoside hydrolase family 43 protein [Clostridiales bacterium]